MDKLHQFFQELYQHFNEHEIEPVIGQMTEDVKWANGMEGGYVYGHEGVRVYWTRQFALISSKVSPLEISEDNGVIKIKVKQVVHDLDGKLLADETVYHIFHLRDGKIAQFDIGERIK